VRKLSLLGIALSFAGVSAFALEADRAPVDNLDHGTDLAVSVDGMPVNNPTHAHGQGYTDLNFMIPELATNIKFTKGTYYADQGDFASVGSVHLSYLDRIDNQVNVTRGNLGFQRMANGTQT